MVRIKRILVAYDGSPHSKKALDWAAELSLLVKAKIRVVKVSEMTEISPLYTVGSGTGLIADIEEIKQADRKLLEDAVRAAKDKGVAITTDLLSGNIALTIIKYSKDNDIDLIVIGTKGHGVLEGLLMGSVTRSLVSLSRIPVLVVKD